MFNSICCVSALEIKIWTDNQKSLYSQNLQFNYFPTYTQTLEWVAYPFSSRSSWPGNLTGVSWIAGGFFTNWAIKEAPIYIYTIFNNTKRTYNEQET